MNGEAGMANGKLIQSVERALDMLLQIAHSQNGLKLNETARLCGLKPTTAYNILRTIEAKGFLSKDDNTVYKLGPAISELSECFREDDIQELVGGYMEQLAKKYPSAVITFAERNGLEIYCKLRKAPHYPKVVAPYKSKYSNISGASVRLLLAFAPDECLMNYLTMNPDEDEETYKAEKNKIRTEKLVIPPKSGEFLAAALVSLNNPEPTHALGIKMAEQEIESTDKKKIISDLKKTASDIDAEFMKRHK